MNKQEYLNTEECNSDIEYDNINENETDNNNLDAGDDDNIENNQFDDNGNPNNYSEYEINDWLLKEFDYNQCNDDVVIKLVDLINNYFNQYNNNINIVNTKFINHFIPFLYKNSKP
jgi:hypothetical protein